MYTDFLNLFLLLYSCWGKCHHIDQNFQKDAYDDMTHLCDRTLFPDIIEAKDVDYDTVAVGVKSDYKAAFKKWFNEYPMFKTLDFSTVSCRMDFALTGVHNSGIRPATGAKFYSIGTKPLNELIKNPFIMKRTGNVLNESLLAVKDTFNIGYNYPPTVSSISSTYPISTVYHVVCYVSEGGTQFPITGLESMESLNRLYSSKPIKRHDLAELVSVAARRVVFAENFIHIWKSKPKERRRKFKPNIVMLQAESTSKVDAIFRLPRAKAQMECDGFITTEFTSTLGENTGPNHNGLELGYKDHEYVSELYGTYNIGDFSKYNFMRDYAVSNGYVTGFFGDRYNGLEYYNKGGSRAFSTVDDILWIKARQHMRDLISVLEGGRSYHCRMDKPEQQGSIAYRTMNEMLLRRDEPQYIYATIECGAHEGFNSTFQQESLIELLNGPAREILLEDTFIMWFGDHGHRITHKAEEKYVSYAAYSGMMSLERANSYISIRVPNKYKDAYPHLEEHLKYNVDKISTLADLREMVMDIIHDNYIKDDKIYRVNQLITYPAFRLNNTYFYNHLVRSNGTRTTYYAWIPFIREQFSNNRFGRRCENEILGRSPAPWNLMESPFLSNRLDYRDHSLHEGSLLRNLSEAKKSNYYDNIYHATGDTGISLFRKLSYDRGCADAGSGDEHCACYSEKAKIYVFPTVLRELSTIKTAQLSYKIAERRAYNMDHKYMIMAKKAVNDHLVAEGMHPYCIQAFIDVTAYVMNVASRTVYWNDTENVCKRDLESPKSGGIISMLFLIDGTEEEEKYNMNFMAEWAIEFAAVVTLNGVSCALGAPPPKQPLEFGVDVLIGNFQRMDKYWTTGYCTESSSYRAYCLCTREYRREDDDK